VVFKTFKIKNGWSGFIVNTIKKWMRISGEKHQGFSIDTHTHTHTHTHAYMCTDIHLYMIISISKCSVIYRTL